MYNGFDIEKVSMKEQDPQARRSNFREVALGYSLEEAMEEARRCLNCKDPMCGRLSRKC